ncbi:hypothetical protein [Komagataeibacter swingsii]|uniref:Uncharacterized protein n=1 Tax=Komagataeibacter swingsii TaxID=215220 RepID=A0A850P289_9PROT|nr:hypothetical protein [Komagataeibacter swingsii]NVN36506.1 hypothetical protein [Komagataeibacter swingsii]
MEIRKSALMGRFFCACLSRVFADSPLVKIPARSGAAFLKRRFRGLRTVRKVCLQDILETGRVFGEAFSQKLQGTPPFKKAAPKNFYFLSGYYFQTGF